MTTSTITTPIWGKSKHSRLFCIFMADIVPPLLYLIVVWILIYIWENTYIAWNRKNLQFSRPKQKHIQYDGVLWVAYQTSFYRHTIRNSVSTKTLNTFQIAPFPEEVWLPIFLSALDKLLQAIQYIPLLTRQYENMNIYKMYAMEIFTFWYLFTFVYIYCYSVQPYSIQLPSQLNFTPTKRVCHCECSRSRNHNFIAL